MARPLQSFVIFVLFQFLFFSNIIILGEANEDSDLMEFANHALAAGKYEAAEDFFWKSAGNTTGQLLGHPRVGGGENKIK